MLLEAKRQDIITTLVKELAGTLDDSCYSWRVDTSSKAKEGYHLKTKSPFMTATLSLFQTPIAGESSSLRDIFQIMGAYMDIDGRCETWGIVEDVPGLTTLEVFLAYKYPSSADTYVRALLEAGARVEFRTICIARRKSWDQSIMTMLQVGGQLTCMENKRANARRLCRLATSSSRCESASRWSRHRRNLLPRRSRFGTGLCAPMAEAL
jgi:hypothetical protein